MILFDYDNQFSGDMYCDECDNEEHFEGAFMECIDEAKSAGWRFWKDIHDQWAHKCPDCVEEAESNP